ncbi:MAG: uncharacterized ferritin-like protein (DUF455 family) [Mariniblastus sp.]|jgi:uncharacterized ferritin-like protein (DUF455 family)
MNITEFAEQIVFGKTLEDKLLRPGKLSLAPRDSPGPSCDTVLAPGRPVGLEMRLGKAGNVQPPSDETLENEQARGQLLHFLANHELLATELMALVLLKFPDAPHAFRQGILVTLQEEQEHTRMYMRRMKECGVEFGSFPLSGQFWRIIEPMQSPMDFVSRLSLTFEQANLDYSLHFANVFKQIGDEQTAGVLQKIYEDEIGHVQHGLHWFRQWKNPEQSDWEAYQASLEFPMSPQRGRGPRCAFNREGRVQAGLTDEFIDAIEVFRQSRGRAPTVRWFTPSAEAELAGELPNMSSAETPTPTSRVVGLMDRLAKDLELTMIPLSKQDDVLLVREMPSREFRKQLIDAGFDLPEVKLFDERALLNERKLHDFSPWAWTPASLGFAHPMIEAARHVPPSWNDSRSELYRKSWSANQLRLWQSEGQELGTLPDWFTSLDCVASEIHQLADVQPALNAMAEQEYEQAIFKLDLGASGRGQRRFSCKTPLTEKDWAWLRAAERGVEFGEPLTDSNQKPQPLGVIEPELDRQIDLSFLWHIPCDSQSPQFMGWTRALVTAGRRYAGTRLSHPFSDLDQALKRFVLSDRCAILQATVDWLESRIIPELVSRGIQGHVGIDALISRDRDGNLKLKPVVELNPRTTMGHVACRLKKRIAPAVNAEYRILSKQEWDTCGGKLRNLELKQIKDGRWSSGVIWLGQASSKSKLVPVVLVGDEAIEVAGRL